MRRTRHRALRWVLALRVALGPTLAACADTTVTHPRQGVARIALEPAFPGLAFHFPVALLQVPGQGDAWYVLERDGRVQRVDAPAGAEARLATALDIRDRVDTRGEGGLLGMAFHPAYPATPQVFLSYTITGSPLVSRIARFTVGPDGRFGAEEVLLAVPQPYANHNGGWLAFGPDDLLYIGLGDGGSAGDPHDNAQNTATLLGSMLRIDVDGPPASGKAYAIPADNPFAMGGARPGKGAPEIYAWGLRNPWRWSFDRASGALWAGDVGQNAWEEIDRIVKGGNYGWRCYEGAHGYNTRGCGAKAGYLPPVVAYDHGEGCSVTGGYVYRGGAIPALQGRYLFADYCSGKLWAFPAAGVAGADAEVLLDTPYRIAAFAEDNAGEIYLLHLADPGAILRLVPPRSP